MEKRNSATPEAFPLGVGSPAAGGGRPLVWLCRAGVPGGQGEGFPAHQVTGLGGLQQPERVELERLDSAAGGDRAQGAGVGGGAAGAGSAYRLEVIEVFGHRVVGRPPCPGDRLSSHAS